MINFLKRYFLNYFFLILLRFKFSSYSFTDFKDLNFKQNDFINYKNIKYFILKENFIFNLSIAHIHTFDFLFYFKKIGGSKGINLSRKNIFAWFRKFKYYSQFPWEGDYPSKRFISIVYNYDFICSVSNPVERKQLNYILNFHIRRILFDINRKKNKDISSYQVLALILIDCLKTNIKTKNFETIKNIINFQLDDISIHRSYNILEHAKFLNNLIEIKNIILFINLEIPSFLENTILSMTALLKVYKHDDSSLPLFNGCNNNHIEIISNISKKEKFLKTVTLKKFKTGIATYKDKQKTLFFDVIKPTINKYHNELSAGTLSLEISAGKEKIITNCGGAESAGKNPAYLKYSAAHSTIIINNTNITEIRENQSNKKFPKEVFFDSIDNEETLILSGTHNGYLNKYKKVCKRELLVHKKMNLIKGEDIIISSKSNFEKTIYHIRFHLMPGISTTVTENKKNVIMKTAKNNMWVFKSNDEILIEKSIYVNNDIALESSQIVITGVTNSLKSRIQWSLEQI